MPLKISFSIDKTQLIVGESPVCQIQLTNTGQKPLEIIQPVSGGGLPAFRVKNIYTGAEELIQGNIMPNAITPTRIINPGEVISIPLPLLNCVGELQVGEYLISAVYLLNNGREHVESDTVKVNIAQIAVSNLFLDSVQGTTVNGVFVNSASAIPQIVATQFELNANGGVKMMIPVGKGTLRSRPCISLPPNNGPSLGNWIAWKDNNLLEFVHYDVEMGLSQTGQFTLPSNDCEIVPTLHIEQNAAFGVRAAGEVIVWTGGETNRDSSLKFINLIPMENKVIARSGMSVNLAGERPEWIRHYVRSDGSKIITFLRKDNHKICLYSLLLPEKGGAGIKQLKEWTGDFVAIGATLGFDDVLRIAVLFWGDEGGEQKLEVLGLALNSGNKITKYHQSIIPWGATVNVESAKVRVRDNGDPAILIRSLDGRWAVYDGYGKLVPVPAPYNESKLAIDIAFFNGTEIVIICAEMNGTISIKRLDGSNLPRTFI